MAGIGPAAGLDDVPEAGWIVRKDWWRQGVATEIMAAALAWFEDNHGPRSIACMIEDGNLGSQRVAARLGFAQHGVHQIECDSPVDILVYQRAR